MTARRLFSTIATAALAALATTSAARADSVSVDFETGPPIGSPVNDEYKDSAFVRFVQADAGYRPYRRSAPDQARSGSVVADVGGDVCAPESPGGGSDCEFATSASTGRLTRTATSVTLYAGLFSTAQQPAPSGVGVRLIGFNAQGQEVTRSAVVTLPAHGNVVGPVMSGASRIGIALPPPTFTTPVTITRAQADIASFELEAVDAANPTQGSGAAIGFDDLTIDYPANSLPQFSITSTPLTKVLAGLTKDIPVTVTRLNGSSGPIALSAAGLPQGVTATFTPNPLPSTQTDATLHLVANASAPRLDNPADVTITADPQSNGNVGPGPLTTHTGVTVGTPFELRLRNGGTTANVGACGPTEVEFFVRRDITFGGSVQLAASNLPAGVTATIPDANVAPGGNLDAERALQVNVAPGASLPGTVTITGTSNGLPARQLQLTLQRTGSAHLADPSATAFTPRRFKPGTTVSVAGTGFCPGTRVQVGPGGGTVDATVAADGQSLAFVTPRDATSGKLTILPPAGSGVAAFQTTDSLTVDNFRNSAGFAFHNPGFNYLSYGELTDAFGNDDMWITINPCWPFGDCRFNTGIPDPLSYAEWGILNPILRSSGGHCFGITRGSWALRTGLFPYSRFASGVNRPFDLPSASGPSGKVGDWLDGQHALQASAEFLKAYAHRDRGVAAQAATANQELSAGRDPIVTMHHDDGSVFGEGHAVLAYDMEQVADGTDIYVYDSNRQSSAAGDPGGTRASVIHITQGGHHWEMTQAGGDVWSGGDDGSLFIASQNSIPKNPSLPSLSSLLDLPALVFGSDGDAQVTATGPGSQTLPIIDDGTHDNSGWVLGAEGSKDVSATITGKSGGTYDAGISGPGFAGTLQGVPTKPGTVDQAGGSPSGHELSFTSGQDRTLTICVATGSAAGGATAARLGADGGGARMAAGQGDGTGARVTTKATKGSEETAGLSKSGQLSYEHDGPATTFSFSLTTVSTNGGPQQFQSPSVRIGSGETVTAAPASSGQTATLTFRSKQGKVRRQTVRNAAKAPAKLKLSAAKVTTAGAARTLRATATVSKLGTDASGVLGVVIKVTRGGKTVARTTVSKPVTANGPVPVEYQLPAVQKKGSYKIRIDARLAVLGAAAGSVTAHKTSTFKVK